MAIIESRSLAEIRKDIKDAIIAKLQDAKTSGNLTDVKYINYGNRTRGDVKIPAVWVIPAAHTPEMAGASRVQHDFTFDFAVIVKDNDPEKGAEMAEDLASRVYDTMTSDRKLNNLVFDVIPTRIDPAYEVESSNNTFWASCQLVFRIQRYQ